MNVHECTESVRDVNRRILHLTFRAERAKRNADVQIALAKRDASIRVARANARGRRFEVEARALRQLAIVQEIDPGARL